MNAIALALIVGLILLLVGIWYFLFRQPPAAQVIPFPVKWQEFLVHRVRFYRELNPAEKLRFEGRIQSFLNRVKISGIDTQINDEDRLLVAASGVIPVFHFANWDTYPNLEEVLIYPNSFRQEDYATEGEDRSVLGMVGWGAMNRKIIFSRLSLHQGFANEGLTNTGIHEFIHLIDKADGATDGVPEYLLQKQFVLPWLKLIYREIEAIKAGTSDIPPYGATNETEFFAVASTYFFQHPHRFAQEHPELYQLFEQIFQTA